MKYIKNSIVTALMLFIASLAISQNQANVGVISQEQNEWCWAGSSKCILDYYGFVNKQCTIADYARSLDNSTFGTTACCTSPTGKCNNPNYLTGSGGISGILQHFGNITSTSSNGALAVAKIQSEFAGHRPFVIFITWSGGGGHFVVGCNYTGTSLTFMDPWQKNGMTTYTHASGGTSVVTSSGTGTWNSTLVLTTPYVATGIANQSFSSDQINVYPNPSDGAVNIASDFNLKTIHVYNTTGQLVDSYTAAGNKSYSLKITTAGLYNIQLITEEGTTINKKVIIQ